MLGFRPTSLSSPRIPAPPTRPTAPLPRHSSPQFLNTQFCIPKSPSKFVPLAQNGNGDDLIKEPGEKERRNGENDDSDSKKDRQAAFNFKWGNLLDPDPDNIFAVGLTGLLAWASVQVLWQLTFISLAILVAALKYTFIAALLIFILFTLL